MNARGWEFAQATARGGSHERAGLPNQDAVLRVDLDGGRGCVLAVADGHGGRPHVRSDRGAQLAVRVACEVVRHAARSRPSLHEDGMAFLRQAAGKLVDQWRIAVEADVKERPFTNDENSRMVGTVEPDMYAAYGSTILLAMFVDGAAFVAQLGDGDVLAVTGDSEVVRPVPRDARLTGVATTSLCLPNASSDFRFAAIPAAASMVLLCTDGYGNSFADPAWMDAATRQIASHYSESGIERVQADLPGWLTESARAGGDDVTAALAVRPFSGAVAAPAGADLDTVDPTLDALPPARLLAAAARAPRSRSVAIAVALAALILGLLLVALGSRNRGDAATSTRSSPAQPTSPTPSVPVLPASSVPPASTVPPGTAPIASIGARSTDRWCGQQPAAVPAAPSAASAAAPDTAAGVPASGGPDAQAVCLLALGDSTVQLRPNALTLLARRVDDSGIRRPAAVTQLRCHGFDYAVEGLRLTRSGRVLTGFEQLRVTALVCERDTLVVADASSATVCALTAESHRCEAVG